MNGANAMMSRSTRGRGSNPRSKANLKPAARRWYVYSRGAGIGWSLEFGPMFQAQAAEAAARLERMNHSQVRPMYAASMKQPG